jgi:hypothetical protein
MWALCCRNHKRTYIQELANNSLEHPGATISGQLVHNIIAAQQAAEQR